MEQVEISFRYKWVRDHQAGCNEHGEQIAAIFLIDVAERVKNEHQQTDDRADYNQGMKTNQPSSEEVQSPRLKKPLVVGISDDESG